MSFAWLFKTLIGTLLLPPANGLLLLGVAGLYRRRRWAFGLVVLATALLVLQSLPLPPLRAWPTAAGPLTLWPKPRVAHPCRLPHWAQGMANEKTHT